MFSLNLKKKGLLAENLAIAFINNKNFKIRDRNWRLFNIGEIDIIAEKDGILNFIEVKSLWLSNYNFYRPEDHFNNRKIIKLKKLALFYANKHNFEKWFLSLITVNFYKNKPKINYYPYISDK